MNWLNVKIGVSAAYLAVFLFGMASLAEAAEGIDTQALYKEHCASPAMARSRLGGVGPALLPENLERLRKPEAAHRHSRQVARQRRCPPSATS
jgi:hypothetical protein